MSILLTAAVGVFVWFVVCVFFEFYKVTDLSEALMH